MTTTPADRLRAAADLVEQRAAAATPGPWVAERRPYSHENVAGHVAAPNLVSTTRAGVALSTVDDTAWITLAGPQIAPHLAAWLRERADYVDAVQVCNEPHALALADAILGGAS